MLENVLNIKGVTKLNREEKSVVKGQSCFDEAWAFGTANAEAFGSAYLAMDVFYQSNC
ncbi:hypothetical protein [Aquimarina algicola]|uniref:hypothetical protein n=1 Tax=Aquimarina algicola TaxID=2589995 RepID=UPI001CF57790|nr:hypothetical protein [Aquimarina algicola]